MSYYEYRIKVLEERVAQLALEQRMKAIPVEAKLVERIALLQAENKALRKVGDKLSDELKDGLEWQQDLVREWNEVKKTKPTK